jgi:hypothetical protein
MKKIKTPDIRSCWEGAGKAQKTTPTSTPNPPSFECQVQTNSPPCSCVLQLQLCSDETNEVPSPQNNEDASTDPELCSPLSPRTENQDSGDELDGESNDGAIYDVDLLPHDPGLRAPINDYDVNEQNAVRRRYIALGPCQPRDHDFPQTDIGGKRCFKACWFDEYNWLEYSVEQDAAFYYVAICSRKILLVVMPL